MQLWTFHFRKIRFSLLNSRKKIFSIFFKSLLYNWINNHSQICFKSKICNKMVFKNRSVKTKQTNLSLKSTTLFEAIAVFWHGVFPDNGVLRNSQVCVLTCFNFLLYLRTLTSFEINSSGLTKAVNDVGRLSDLGELGSKRKLWVYIRRGLSPG